MKGNSYGLWHVTTEGDCEGRTTKDLGVHEGHLDDIAFALASAAYYSLHFKRLYSSGYKAIPPGIEVSVLLSIESKTWDLTPPARRAYFESMLAGRNVSVSDGKYFASVKLTSGRTPQDQARARRDATAKAGIAKLTHEERVALGLEVSK